MNYNCFFFFQYDINIEYRSNVQEMDISQNRSGWFEFPKNTGHLKSKYEILGQTAVYFFDYNIHLSSIRMHATFLAMQLVIDRKRIIRFSIKRYGREHNSIESIHAESLNCQILHKQDVLVQLLLLDVVVHVGAHHKYMLMFFLNFSCSEWLRARTQNWPSSFRSLEAVQIYSIPAMRITLRAIDGQSFICAMTIDQSSYSAYVRCYLYADVCFYCIQQIMVQQVLERESWYLFSGCTFFFGYSFSMIVGCRCRCCWFLTRHWCV